MLTLGDRYVQPVLREPNGLQFNTIPLIFPPTHWYLFLTELQSYLKNLVVSHFSMEDSLLFLQPPPPHLLVLYHK